MAAKDELGRRGEDLAVAWAETRGWTVLARNWRGERGEARHRRAGRRVRRRARGEDTRSSTSLGGPIAAVTRQKVQRLRQLTGEWLVRGRVEWAAGSPDGACGAAAVVLSGTADIRIDVLGILWPPDATPRFEHVRGIG